MIRLKVPKKFGKRLYNFEVEAETFFDVLIQAERLSFNSVDKCGVCGSDSLKLSAYVTEKDHFEYVKVQCLNCRASLTFGKKKNDPETYYLRKNEDGAYDWKEFKSDKPESNTITHKDLASNMDDVSKKVKELQEEEDTDPVPF
jgi:MinD superfamily P-loop ATPase